MVLPVYALLCASILDFKARLANRCRVLPVYALLRALILDFRPRLENRCRVLPVYALLCAAILDFRSRLANRCSVLAAALRNGPPTVVVAATRSASDSILRCRKGERFRLQDAVAYAGGGRMHEGGIALSKKPPEWYLSPL